jgi:hypothetical protein
VRRYLRYIACCHGAAGDGMGDEKSFLVFQVIRTELSLKVAFFTLLPTVSTMGSHANQVDAHERWLIADYVLKPKSKL